MLRSTLAIAVCTLIGCGGPPSDSPRDAGDPILHVSPDAGGTDAQTDASAPDSGTREPDAGDEPDGGPADAGAPDPDDGGPPDSGPAPEADAGAFTEPLYLPGSDLEACARGRAVFEREYSPDGGILGLENGLAFAEHQVFPVPDGGEVGRDYNGTSCKACHNVPFVGGQGDLEHGSYVDTFLYNTVTGPYPFAEVTQVKPHLAPSLYGMAALDDVPDAYILANCGVDADFGIHGLPMSHGGDSELERFGRRGVTAHLTDFVGGAHVGEMGVMSPAFAALLHVPATEAEISDADVADATTFVRSLAPPPALPPDPEGARLFASARCGVCHDLSRQGTDQCLHDMGPGLRDDFNPLNNATTVDSFRTARLLGVRFQRLFLHDGRATSAQQAVDAHGGEATQSVAAYRALDDAQRAALLRFVGTL